MKKIDLRFCHKILPNGLPKGYEFVRFGFAKQGELYLGSGDENVKVIVRKIDEPNSNVEGDKVNKIEGLPEGWELVRIGTPVEGESYIVSGGCVGVCESVRFAKNYVIVRKIEPPKPKCIPWTYETCPVGSVVVNKTDDYKALVISAGLSSACFGVLDASYANLLDQYTQLDGTPCGTVEP